MAFPKSRSKSNAQSTRSRKARARDLRRMLEKVEKLPADVRLNHERELQSLEFEIQDIESKNAEKAMIKKYHMVRFFERRKAERALKKAERRLAEASDASEKATLTKEVHDCQVDLNYTQFHPLNQTYTSLFADIQKAKAKGDQTWQPNRATDMWKTVETAMADGKLQDLRNGRLTGRAKSASSRKLLDPKAKRRQDSKRQAETVSRDAADINSNREVEEETYDDEEEDGDHGESFFE